LNGPPAARRKWWKLLLLFATFSLVALSLLWWYVSTDSFQQRVRRKVIASLEEATGGRVEMGEFHTIPFRLRVDIRNLTIHGREASDQTPYFHVDRLEAELKIISIFSKEVGLHALTLDGPVLHIVVYPDGSTNQPAPAVKRVSTEDRLAQLFSLKVSRVEVHRGELLWATEKIPLEFDARNVALELNYSFLHGHYEAELAVGGAPTRYQQYPAFSWQAQASVVLARDHADIQKLDIGLKASKVHLTGQVQNFQHPQFTGTYVGTLDIAELADLTETPPQRAKGSRPEAAIRKGSALISGKGKWSLQDFSTEGVLEIKDLDWSDRAVSLRNARVSTGYTITSQRLRLSSLKAGLFGGELLGEVDVTNWQASLEPAAVSRKHRVVGRVPPGSVQRGAIRLRLNSFPITPALLEVSSTKLPLDRMKLSGNASGTVEMLWVGSIQDAETKLSLIITPPSRSSAGELAVKGEIRGIYRGSRDELSLEQFHMITSASEITAQGELSSTSQLRLSISSRNLNEWQALLHAAWGPEELPFAVHGPVNFNGSASGRLSAFTLSGNLHLEDFDTTFVVGPRRTRRTVSWNSLSGTLQYSNDALAVRNATLMHDAATVHFDGSTALTLGVLTQKSPFNVRLEVTNGDVAEVTRLAGYSYPVSGTFQLSAHASGTPSDPHGEGRVEVSNAVIYGNHAALMRGDVRLSQGELQFNNIETSFAGAPVMGSAAISTVDDNFRLNLSVRSLDLAGFPQLHSQRITIDGRADLTAHVVGTLDQPLLEAHVHLRDLAFDKEPAGDFFLDIVPRGRQVEVQAHSAFESANLAVTGGVRMEAGWPSDLDISFQKLDLDSLLKIYLGERITSHAITGGTLSVRGPLRSPRDLKISARLDSMDAEIEHVAVHAAEPIRFEILDQTLRLENFHLAGAGTDFHVHGRALLSKSGEMDLRGEGTVNMTLLQTLNPNLTARGMVAVSLSAGGTLSQPALEGRLELKDASISHSEFPSGLSELNGVLLFDQNRLSIENMSGKTGGGVVTLAGSGTYNMGVFNMDFSANARGVRLRYPPGVSSTADANLRLTGSGTSAVLSGDVLVTKLSVTPGFDFGAYLEKAKLSSSVARGDTVASHVRLDVHIRSTPELQMQTAVAKLSGTADLQLRGTVARPVVLGRAEILEGEIVFNGTRYRVERGEVTFSNPAKTEPLVDLRLATRVRDYDITVGINGDASKANGLTAKWQSEPPLPEPDVIALLALGRTTEESAALQSSGTSSLSSEASNLLINQALSSAVSSRVQRLFGVSRIKVDPQGLTSTTNVVRGPQVTLEQQVASKLTITYSANVSTASQQIIQVEYNVTRNVSIIALRDQNGVVSFDIKVRKQKK
jgi:translocation and assembly module TamB